MSLVDYASSSDDEDDVVPDAKEEEEEEEEKEAPKEPHIPKHHASPSTTCHNIQKSDSSTNRQPERPPPPIEKLPDASLLLNSPTISFSGGSDHASRVAAAMAESASRKRDSDASPSSLPRGKVPRGGLKQSKNVPDTVGGVLVPPQLRGRSNIVTEDIGKLFVKRQAESSSH